MQIDSTKSRLQEFDTAITDRLNDEAHIIIEGGKSQPYDWSDHPFATSSLRAESLNPMTGPIILSMRTSVLLKKSTRWSQTAK